MITSDGDVLFVAYVNGGSSLEGVFRFDSQTRWSKVVAHGDPAPSSLGATATLNGPGFGGFGAVSGRSLVFTSYISGGITDQAVLVINNVRSNPPGIDVVAYEGQPTGTEIGGFFSHPDNPSSNNTPFLFDYPKIRADGGVIFKSLLRGTTGGLVTQKGNFLWNKRDGFKKILVEGDKLPSGGVLSDLSAPFIINDIGQVFSLTGTIK